MLRLGVLDQSPVRSGGAVADAIHETLELAELCDRLGYHRYWLAEHHSTPGLAGPSPAMPTGPTAPEMWLLGSSDASAAVAAHFGTGFSFAHFINQEGGAEVTRAYRRQFKPSQWLQAPRASAAVFVVCADTEAEAQRLA